MKKVVFLDRDGTINVDRGYVSLVEDWEFEDGVIQALTALQAAGFTLAIVTNQSGIGRGMYEEDAMHKLHAHMNKLLADAGVTIHALAYCPHAPEDNCECRKPQPGMAKIIERQIGAIDYANSWMVGDRPADVGFGKAIGAKTALIKSSYWNENDIKLAPDIVVSSLFEAVPEILL